MATPNLWKAYLKPSDNSWAYINSLGDVTITTDSSVGLDNPIKDMPVNWEEIELGYTRSESLDGIFVKTSGEYEFVGDAAKIIRHFIFTEGYTANLIFEIYIRNEFWQYELYEKSDISFETPPIQSPTMAVNAVMFEKGLAQKIKNSLTVPYELDNSESITVFFAGTRVIGKYNYRFGEEPVILRWNIGTGLASLVNPILANVNNEGFLPVAIAQTTDRGPRFIGTYAAPNLINDEGYIIKNIDTEPIAVSYQVESLQLEWNYTPETGTPPATVTATLEVLLVRQLPGGIKTITTVASFPTRTIGTTPIVEGPITLAPTAIPDLLPGEMLFFTFGVVGPLFPTGDFANFAIKCTTFADCRVSILTESNTKPSNVKGLRQFTMFKKLVTAIAAGEYGTTPYASSFLSSPSNQLWSNFPWHTIFTNGLEIKGVTNTAYKVQLDDMIKHFKALYPIGIGVENDVVILEHLSYFYNDSITLGDLGEGRNAQITMRSELGNLIKVGYEFENNRDILNGNDDYNTQSNFKTNGKFMNEKTIEFISPYTASMYEIERARVEDSGKDLTGTKVNDQIYVFSVYPDDFGLGVWALNYCEIFGGIVTGVNFPEWAYNVDLSPRRNMDRLRPLLHSKCYPSLVKFDFQTSERSDSMTSQFRISASPITYFPNVVESSDLIPNREDLIYLPYTYEAEHIIPFDLRQLMATNPYGAFNITINGKAARIFIDEIKVRPGKRNTFSVKGRFTPSTDLTLFI